MKKLVILFILMIILSSCVKESDWGVVIIPAGKDLVFSNEETNFDVKAILVQLETGTMEIERKDLVHRISYLKLAFPDQDITIDYVIRDDNGKITFEPRFINLPDRMRQK